MDYEKAYKVLFNGITDAIDELNQTGLVTLSPQRGINILKAAQCKTEEMYLSGE